MWVFGIMDTNVACLSCAEVQASGYFQLSDMRYNYEKAVTERVIAAIPQLYLIWIPAQIFEYGQGTKRPNAS